MSLGNSPFQKRLRICRFFPWKDGVSFLHGPANPARLRDALFLSPDDYERSEAFRQIQEELDYMVKLRPDYVLFHYPKPVILDPQVDWSSW